MRPSTANFKVEAKIICTSILFTSFISEPSLVRTFTVIYYGEEVYPELGGEHIGWKSAGMEQGSNQHNDLYMCASLSGDYRASFAIYSPSQPGFLGFCMSY